LNRQNIGKNANKFLTRHYTNANFIKWLLVWDHRLSSLFAELSMETGKKGENAIGMRHQPLE